METATKSQGLLKKVLDAAAGRELIRGIGSRGFRSARVRRMLLDYMRGNLEKGNYEAIVKGNRPRGVKRDVAWAAYALLRSLDRALAEGRLSAAFQDKLVKVFLGDMVLNWAERGKINERFKAKGELGPPGLLLISPAKGCNLRCTGCYAASGSHPEKLTYEEFHRIISEAEDMWGVRFFVLTGGEPFIWRDKDKRLLDVVAEHPGSFFMSYTNGTLIDERAADRLAELGNFTPAISVEGFKKETDDRRGEGVYDRITEVMARLRERGVMFGISLTATHFNYKTLLSDEFLEEMFEGRGATYGWVFQYMPIGRGVHPELMPTPEDRMWMWRREQEILRKKNYFLLDFWNSGTVGAGCISAGRHTGYLHINWDADVTPCAFMPLAPVNLREIYARGGTLEDAYDAPFFRAVRKWQAAYGYGRKSPEEHHNWIMTCPIRDHFAMVKRLAEKYKPRVIDEAVAELLSKPEYIAWMKDYDRRLKELSDPIWKKEYLGE